MSKRYLLYSEKCHEHARSQNIDLDRALQVLHQVFPESEKEKAKFYWDIIAMGMPLGTLVNMIKEPFIDKQFREYYPNDGTTSTKNESLSDFMLAYVKNFNEMLTNGYSIILCGDNSLGKTYSALTLMRNIYRVGRITRRDYTVFYTTFLDLFEQRNKEYSEGSEFWNEIINCDFLVLDELGKENKVSDAVIVFLEKILKHRAHNLKPTLIITNLMPKSPEGKSVPNIYDHYGKSCYEILTEKYRFLQLGSRSNKNLRMKKTAWSI